MIENKYLCSVAYDGSDYKGLVKQPNKRTILGTMEEAFLKSFDEKIFIIPAGRTDAKVHARDQRIQFVSKIPIDSIVRWWNNSLPSSIKVNSCNVIKDDNFHVRFSVVEKQYKYLLSTNELSPFEARYKYFCKGNISLEKLENTLSFFVGEKDFSAFSKLEPEQNPLRTIRKVTFEEKNGNISISLYGKSFLRYMVRRIVGSAIAVSIGIETKANIGYAMKNRVVLKHTAPACGLFLEKISYKEVIK